MAVQHGGFHEKCCFYPYIMKILWMLYSNYTVHLYFDIILNYPGRTKEQKVYTFITDQMNCLIVKLADKLGSLTLKEHRF